MALPKRHPLDEFKALIHSKHGPLCIGNSLVLFSCRERLSEFLKVNRRYNFDDFLIGPIYRRFVREAAAKARRNNPCTSVLLDPDPRKKPEEGRWCNIQLFASADDRTEAEREKEAKETEEASNFKSKK